MKEQKVKRLRRITKAPALAATDWGTHTIFPGAGIRFISDTALLIPAHILPVTKTYSCHEVVCFKTGMEF